MNPAEKTMLDLFNRGKDLFSKGDESPIPPNPFYATRCIPHEDQLDQQVVFDEKRNRLLELLEGPLNPKRASLKDQAKLREVMKPLYDDCLLVQDKSANVVGVYPYEVPENPLMEMVSIFMKQRTYSKLRGLFPTTYLEMQDCASNTVTGINVKNSDCDAFVLAMLQKANVLPSLGNTDKNTIVLKDTESDETWTISGLALQEHFITITVEKKKWFKEPESKTFVMKAKPDFQGVRYHTYTETLTHIDLVDKEEL